MTNIVNRKRNILANLIYSIITIYCTVLHYCSLCIIVVLFDDTKSFCILLQRYCTVLVAGCPGSSEVPRNLLTRWDVSSIPANGIFLTKKLKNEIKLHNGWRTIESLVHKIRRHGRRGKGMAESFSREKLRHAPQKEGG